MVCFFFQLLLKGGQTKFEWSSGISLELLDKVTKAWLRWATFFLLFDVNILKWKSSSNSSINRPTHDPNWRYNTPLCSFFQPPIMAICPLFQTNTKNIAFSCCWLSLFSWSVVFSHSVKGTCRGIYFIEMVECIILVNCHQWHCVLTTWMF